MVDDSDALWLGLISGTSADGIDAALVRFDPAPRVVATQTHSYPESLRQRLVELGQGNEALSLDQLGVLDHEVGSCFADAALALLERSGTPTAAVSAIGSHGQTLRHRPGGPSPFTLQVGDPSLIAERTGCRVVADFRRRDLAAGGQGAPLLPALHAATLASAEESRAVLNLGGIANLTLLPAAGPVRGFDSGPANALLDAWCLLKTASTFDRGGHLAAKGNADPALLRRLLDEPWFSLPPPKSTGREQFHLAWVRERGGDLDAFSAADVQATLVALTVETVAQALRRELPDCQRLLVCGGGVHNPLLLATLQQALPGLPVCSSADYGLDPDFVEAIGFAWLAREALAGRPGNLPSVTGARGPRILGAVYAA